MDYLLKTEPSTYSFADLQREKTTIWDGVSNPVALKNMRGMKPGDRLVIYHTGDEKSAVGTATVVSVDVADAKNPQVKIKVGRANSKPVTLAEAKANKLFADSPLARQGRLSVVPLTESQFKFLTEHVKVKNPTLFRKERERRMGHPLQNHSSLALLTTRVRRGGLASSPANSRAQARTGWRRRRRPPGHRARLSR